MKRIAFMLGADQKQWLGGLSYVRNLVRAIVANPDRSVSPVLLAHPDLSSDVFAGFPPVEVVRTVLANHRHPYRLAGRVVRRAMDRDTVLERLLCRHTLNALSHSVSTGARSKVPAIGWIPDFQHVRMPHLFSHAERKARDGHYRRLIDGCSVIILSSNDARSDFASFAPDSMSKARVLHFVSTFEHTGDVLAPGQLRARFGINGPFFHLPNQFWAHKNHAVVVEALGILRSRGLNVLVLATGNPVDYRNPRHFSQLMSRAKDLGVTDAFRVLGMVTLPELHSLMLNSLAIINPSTFEGWSTTVEESKSLGLPIILSDIPVHVEQAPPLGRYFKVDSADALAEVMQSTMRDHDPTAATRWQAEAASALPGRVLRFGAAYEGIASEVC